jgi:hypothetical protein
VPDPAVPEPEAPPVARGPAPDLTPADLDALAAVTPRDVRDAVESWEAEAPAPYRGLLRAQPEDDGSSS